MADANATEVQIDTAAHETTTGTKDHDRAAEVRVGGGTHEHVARVRSIRRIVAQNRLPLHGMGMVRDTTRALIGAMVVDTEAEAQTT